MGTEINSIEDFKKEIQGLEFKKQKYERALIVAQTNYDNAIKTLKDKYNIEEDELDSLIESKQTLLSQAKEKIQNNLKKLTDYVEEIGKVVNGL